MAKKRPYSTAYMARSNPQRYLLSGIPPTLWRRVRVEARKERVALRHLILRLLEDWVNKAPARHAANARSIADAKRLAARGDALAQRGQRDVADEEAEQPEDED
jgi:hypothetical protein